MNRALGPLVALTAVGLAAPMLAAAAQAAVPTLITLLIVLLIWRMAFPTRR